MPNQQHGLAAHSGVPLGLTVLSGLGGLFASTYLLLGGNRNAKLMPAPTVTAKLSEAPTRVSFMEEHKESRLDDLLTSIGLKSKVDDNDSSWGTNVYQDDLDVNGAQVDIQDTLKTYRDAIYQEINNNVASIVANYFNGKVQTAMGYPKSSPIFMFSIPRRLYIPIITILRHLLWDLRQTLHKHYVLMAFILIVAIDAKKNAKGHIADLQKRVQKASVAVLRDQEERNSQHYRLIMDLFGRGKQLNQRLFDIEDHIDNHATMTKSELGYFSQMVPALFAALIELQDQRDTPRIEDTPRTGIEDILKELADTKRNLAEERDTMAKKFDDAVAQMQRDMDDKIRRAVEEALANKTKE